MNKPVLLVLAAGLGSRYGGLKQLEPVGDYEQIIIDYSIFDAKRAGFEEVIFVIRRENESAFQETIAKRVGSHMKIQYAYQDLSDLPEGFVLPEGRTKPWGTAHAALSARHLIQGHFAIINADDFYGAEAFQKMYQFLWKQGDTSNQYSLVGYLLKNTVTEHGSVSRGICTVDAENKLQTVTERTHIVKGEHCPRFTTDGGESWEDLSSNDIVSMNLWGYSKEFLSECEKQFASFLKNDSDPLTKEFYLPSVTDSLISQGNAEVSVLSSEEQWYGITYPEDRPLVVEAIARLTKEGKYPENLWS